MIKITQIYLIIKKLLILQNIIKLNLKLYFYYLFIINSNPKILVDMYHLITVLHKKSH
jgi:hypothetical protein